MAGTIKTGCPSRKTGRGAFSAISGNAAGVSSFLAIFDTPLIETSDVNKVIIQGLDASNLPVDISQALALVASSADTTVIQVGTPNGAEVPLVPVGPGTANVTITIAFKGGSPGPFTLTIPVTVVGVKGASLQITYGTLTIA